MFRTDLLSIIRSLNTAFTAICIWCLTWKNNQVFQRTKEERLLLKILKNRRHSWIWNTIRHNEFVVNILEGAISGKKAVGRPRLRYLKQVARDRGADSYTAMKRMACNDSRWKAANQSKDRWIRKVRNDGVRSDSTGGGTWFKYAAHKTWPIWNANKYRRCWTKRSDGSNNDDKYWQRRRYVISDFRREVDEICSSGLLRSA